MEIDTRIDGYIEKIYRIYIDLNGRMDYLNHDDGWRDLPAGVEAEGDLSVILDLKKSRR